MRSIRFIKNLEINKLLGLTISCCPLVRVEQWSELWLDECSTFRANAGYFCSILGPSNGSTAILKLC